MIRALFLALIASMLMGCSDGRPSEYVLFDEVVQALVVDVSHQPEHSVMEGKVAYTVPARWKVTVYHRDSTYSFYSMKPPTYEVRQVISLRYVGMGYRGASGYVLVPTNFK